MKTHWKKSFNSPYLGSWDLEENQTELTLTIKEAKSEMTKGLKENSIKNIIYFEENYKPMIVNSGNSKIISRLSGSNFLEDWAGTKITIYSKEVRAFGETHEALRVKEKTTQLPILTEKHPKFKAVKEALKSGNYTIEQVKKKYTISKEIETILIKK